MCTLKGLHHGLRITCKWLPGTPMLNWIELLQNMARSQIKPAIFGVEGCALLP